VVFSYARSKGKLQQLAREAHASARAGTPREAVRDADAVVLAVHWSRLDEVLQQAGDLSGKLIVTCCLPMNDDNTGLVVAHTTSGAESAGPSGAAGPDCVRIHTVPSEVLFSTFEDRLETTRPSLIYCGDDASGRRSPRSWSATLDSIRWMPGC